MHDSIQRHVYLSAMVILPTALSSLSELTTAGRVSSLSEPELTTAGRVSSLSEPELTTAGRVFSTTAPSKSSPRPTNSFKKCPKSHYTATY